MYYPTSCVAEKETASSVRLNGVALNLSKIADETGIDPGYLSRIFKGRSPGSANALRKISQAIGIPIDHLMDSLTPRPSRSTISKT